MMLPATCPSATIACAMFVVSARTFAQCVTNASQSRAGKAAIRVASGSRWCSNRAGRSASRTARSAMAGTADAMADGAGVMSPAANRRRSSHP